MGFGFRQPETERIAADAGRFLDAWQIDLPQPGILLVKPLRPGLTYADLLDLVNRLLASEVLGDAALFFDCSELRSIETPWTAVFALWLHLARLAPRGCRLVSLSGQPAAMAGLALRGVPQSLIRIEPTAARDAA
jgi:hypothetical protein